jgi:hypothetical protein
MDEAFKRTVKAMSLLRVNRCQAFSLIRFTSLTGQLGGTADGMNPSRRHEAEEMS